MHNMTNLTETNSQALADLTNAVKIGHEGRTIAI